MKPVFLGSRPRLWDYAQLSTEKLFSITGNTGNLAFRYALFKHLGRKGKFFHWNSDVKDIERAGDVAVLPLANQLGTHDDKASWAEKVEDLKIPVLAVGLGAQASAADGKIISVPDGTKRWIRAISERRAGEAPNILVRGRYTEAVLESLGIKDGVQVTGCPSFFINPAPNLGSLIKGKSERSFKRIGVAAGNPATKRLSTIERDLFSLAETYGGDYVVQHPFSFVKAVRDGVHEPLGEEQKAILDYLGGASIDSLYARARVYFDVDAWLEDLRKHDLFVGTRIHGIILALQAGVPAVCITHDSRTEELCETLNVPCIPARKLEAQTVSVSAFRAVLEDLDPEKFDKNRRRLCTTMKNVFVNHGLEISGSLESLADGDFLS